METLNRLHRELATLVDAGAVRRVAATLVGEILGGTVTVVQRDTEGNWKGVENPSTDLALFDWAWNHRQRAGHGTGTLFDHRLSVWPLVGSSATLGLLVLEATVERTEWIESLAALVASALERVELIEAARAQDRQVETERTRNALLHSLSHDLRTPLTIINGSLETLESSQESRWAPDDKKLMGAVRRETWALARQVENLLDLSRLTERGLPWTMETVPAEDPLCAAVDHFQALHPECAVTRELPEDLPLARMEPRLVVQALANYLDNAWEYSGGLGIETSVGAGEGRVRYEVRDRGPGVAPEQAHLIFAKFVRGTTDKSSGHRGTGLGLAIVHEVARIHHGTAGVLPREGGGSVFFLEIPQEAP